MKSSTMIHTALVAAAITATQPAKAAVLDFSGSMNATASVGPDASCAPLPFRGTISNGSGASSLGSYSYSHSVCLAGGVGPVAGSFLFDFGADEFFGSLTGSASASATPGVFDQLFTYTILGGTGRFLDATGTFMGNGTVDTRNPPPRVAFSFDGQVNAPAVPEPATWVMMLLGFGTIGLAMRGRRPPLPQLA